MTEALISVLARIGFEPDREGNWWLAPVFQSGLLKSSGSAASSTGGLGFSTEPLDEGSVRRGHQAVMQGFDDYFAVWERLDLRPDLMTCAKSIAGGLPLAAVVGRATIMDAIPPGGTGGTFAGNPVACRHKAKRAVADDRSASVYSQDFCNCFS